MKNIKFLYCAIALFTFWSCDSDDHAAAPIAITPPVESIDNGTSSSDGSGNFTVETQTFDLARGFFSNSFELEDPDIFYKTLFLVSDGIDVDSNLGAVVGTGDAIA